MKVDLNEDKLLRAEIESFKNGLRLHFDSIKLFKNKSYPSSYFLSVLALEEFGKQRLIDEIIFRFIEHRNEFDTKDDFKKWCKLYEQVLLSHSAKQGFAVSDDFPLGNGHSRMQRKYLYKMFSHKKKRKLIDDWKMKSVYVGFERNSLKGRIQTPVGFIKRKKAQDQITAINDYIINYIILVRSGRWKLDNESLSRYFNISLLKKITNIWKDRPLKTKKKLNNYLRSGVKKL